MIGSQEVLRGTSKSHEQVTQMPKVPVPITMPSFSQFASIVSCVVPYNQLTEEEKTKASFIDGSPQCAGTTQKWTTLALLSIFMTSLRMVVMENLPSGKNSEQCPWLFTLLGKRNSSRCNYIPTHGLWPLVWLHGQGLGRNIIEKSVSRKFAAEVYRQAPPNGQKCEDICISCDCSPKNYLGRQEL